MKAFLKILLKICAIITGTGGAIGVLWVAFSLTQKVINPPVTKTDVKEIVKEEVAPIISTLNDHLEATKTQQADFSTLESSHINALKMINRLDEVIKYYEKKAENEKKNNETGLYWIPLDTTRLNILSNTN
jgi:hypothetical protein